MSKPSTLQSPNVEKTGIFRQLTADPATKEALRYRTALEAGFDSLKKRPLTTRTAEEVCTMIRDVRMTVRKVPGTKLAGNATGEIIYTPPEGESRLRDKLANWEQFIHDNRDIDPVVRMAVSHYQFEAIHPFTDGNGRILNLLMLVEQGLLDIPVLYLSRYVIRNKAAYYNALLAVTTHGDWENWILYMLHATEETAKWTLAKIEAVRKLIEQSVRPHQRIYMSSKPSASLNKSKLA